jgi:membrane protein implicated in regulation of membrane protease activity
MAQESSIKSRGPIAAHPVTSAVIAILTIAAIFFAVYVPLFARATPKVGDFPFFYFYLLIYMPVVAIVCWIIITLQKRLKTTERPSGGNDGQAAESGRTL